MGVTDWAFNLFAFCTLIGGTFTVVSRDPVHALMWMVLSFLSATALFALLAAKPIAIFLTAIYVCAVTVLFGFVLWLSLLPAEKWQTHMTRYAPMALLLAAILILEGGVMFGLWWRAPPPPEGTGMMLGLVIYQQYIYLFQTAGLILLVALIGVIVLILRPSGEKRPSPLVGVARWSVRVWKSAPWSVSR